MAYINCPECGQKALSVATRCPRCATAFERQVIPVPSQRRFPLGLLAAGVGVTLLVAISSRLNLGVNTPAPDLTAGLTPPPRPAPSQPTPPQPAPRLIAESVTTPPATPVTTAHDIAPAPADTARHETPMPSPTQSPAPALVEAVRRDAPPVEPAGSASTARRYASTWLNVRAQRSSKAAIVRVLRPGELVLVGTQQEGWYPVIDAAQTAGFVDRRLLDTSPPVTP